MLVMDYLQLNNNEINTKNYHSNGGKRKKCSYANNEQCIPLKQRSQANARERDRTHSVNTAFSTLRTLIPTEPKDRKLSKIETLRLASSYISHLGMQLMAGPVDQPCLRISKQCLDEASCSSNRHPVCIFCIAHKKSSKLPHIEEFEPTSMQLEGHIYINTPPIHQEVLNNEIIGIYYQ